MTYNVFGGTLNPTQCNAMSLFRFDNIGLRKFTTASLFLELLSPVSFLMVIIIQLHYFHAGFLKISSLDRFKKYAQLFLAVYCQSTCSVNNFSVIHVYEK